MISKINCNKFFSISRSLNFIFYFCLLIFSDNLFAKSDQSKTLSNSSNRKHIHIVGSSTVYPFISSIAESFGYQEQFKTPVVEATGTGGGFKIFCEGIGKNYPDMVSASRKIQNSEIKKCQENNINNVQEILIGYDGIVLANAIGNLKYNLSLSEIFLALANEVPNPKNPDQLIKNFYQKWNEINPSLPNKKIVIYGPPSTSGTRDSFAELVLEKTCIKNYSFIKNYPDEKIRAKKCRIIRSDSSFIEAGENDNLIVQKLKNNPDALGIFGFSFLQENRHIIQPSMIDDVEPNIENIISKKYQISRPLFIYFKKEHLDLIYGIRQFISEIISSNTLGKEGYLMHKGLIPLSDFELAKVSKKIMDEMKN